MLRSKQARRQREEEGRVSEAERRGTDKGDRMWRGREHILHRETQECGTHRCSLSHPHVNPDLDSERAPLPYQRPTTPQPSKHSSNHAEGLHGRISEGRGVNMSFLNRRSAEGMFRLSECCGSDSGKFSSHAQGRRRSLPRAVCSERSIPTSCS